MTRREWLALSGAAVLSSCGRKKGTGYEGYALVAAAGEKAISVVDLLSFRLIRSIPLDSAPTAIVPAPDFRRIYVLTPETGSVHVFTSGLAHVKSTHLSRGLSSIRLTQDGKRLLATSNATNEILDVDPESLRVNHRYKLAVQPAEMDVVNPGYAVIASGPAGVVELFNLESGARHRYAFGGEIGTLRFRSDGRLLLVANLAEPFLNGSVRPGPEGRCRLAARHGTQEPLLQCGCRATVCNRRGHGRSRHRFPLSRFAG